MIEIVAIGDEVLHGYTVNSNASFLAKFLAEAGFLVSFHHVVGDDKKRCHELLQSLIAHGSFIIVTGGLGPTLDDHTRAIMADLFHTSLEFDPELYKTLSTRFPQSLILKDQATIPKGAKILENKIGTASGLVFKDKKATLIALPGVPQELRALVQEYLIPLVKEAGVKEERLYVELLHFIRLDEAKVDPLLRELKKQYPHVDFGIYPGYGTLTLHLKAAHADAIRAPKEKLLSEWGDAYYQSPSGTLEEALHLRLIEKQWTLATAESCTGGALASRFVIQPNASKYFQGAVVAYTNEMKIGLLGVKPETLQHYGAVSEQVTYEMAAGIQALSSALCSVAVSGILGPTGGTKEKPVGTICTTLLLRGKACSWTMHHSGNREVILEKTIQEIISKIYLLTKEVVNFLEAFC